MCHKFYQKNPGKVISKLNFCSVFQNAWLSAVTPANICGKFKKAEDGDIGNSRDVTEGNPIFSVEEELRYVCRFEEGYDLFDSSYEAWLKVSHPKTVCDNVGDILAPSTPVATSISSV